MKKIGILCVLLSGLWLVMQSFSNAFMNDSAVSSENVFQAIQNATPTSTISVSPTPLFIAQHIVISEVQISGSGGSGQDFVELYNPTGTPFNLNGHRLVKRTTSSVDSTLKSWTIDAFVPAHGFYLWASTSGGYAGLIGADASTSATLAANNSIALRSGSENTGVIIDALSWSSSATALREGADFSQTPADNQSIERKAYMSSTSDTMTNGVDTQKGNGFDTDNNNADFFLRSVSFPQNSASSLELP